MVYFELTHTHKLTACEACRWHLAGAWASAMDGLAIQSVGLRPTFIQFQNAYSTKITKVVN